MSTTNFLSLLGGLALFLYGMQMMSSGLEAAAGDRMKEILEKLTSNRFLGVLVGAAITAVIQSSSATTVMTVGFVNAGMMSLTQAVWIIMGANIGTTITGQLIALDVGAIAPLIAFIGVVLVVFIKKPQLQHIGTIFAGLGVLFIGMEMMSSAMLPLREEPAFIQIAVFNAFQIDEDEVFSGKCSDIVSVRDVAFNSETFEIFVGYNDFSLFHWTDEPEAQRRSSGSWKNQQQHESGNPCGNA